MPHVNVQSGQQPWQSPASGTVAACVQVLPFASDETLSKLEANISGLPAVTDVMAMGMTLERLTEVLLEGIGVDAEHVSSITPQYGPCDKEGLQARSPTLVQAFPFAEAFHCAAAVKFRASLVLMRFHV